MSDTTTIPFEGTLAAAPVQPELAPPADRTKLFALLGGAAVLVVAVAVYFLVFAGGDASTDAVKPPTSHAVVPVPATEPTAVTPPVTPRKVNAKNFGHNPFRALLTESDTAAGGATGTDTGTGAATTTGGTTAGTTTPVGTTDPGTTPTTAPVTPVVTADHTFRVVGVSSDQTRITVRVDGKSYSGLKAGDVFATYFKVVVIGGKVNGFQFGDEKFSVFGTKKLSIAA
jgi:hypothetical protein